MVAHMSTALSVDTVHSLLESVCDPEIPVLTVADLGIIRDVRLIDDRIEVTITPTYSGCPAMNTIEQDIRKVLAETGMEIVVHTSYSPAWSSDWMSENGREKLRAYGIAPPQKSTHSKRELLGEVTVINCPHCGSDNTRLISEFGSTACKAMHHCDDCLQPFDYFKCI